MTELKKGRFRQEEMGIIERAASHLSPGAIAKSLNRGEKAVRDFIVEKLSLIPIEDPEPEPVAQPVAVKRDEPSPKSIVRRLEQSEHAAVTNELRQTELWKRLIDEFEPDEIKYLEERYSAIVAQFMDVAATEETQILHAIKFELLMSRNLVQRKKALASIRMIEEMQKVSLEEYCPNGEMHKITPEQRGKLLALETTLNAARGDEQSKTTEYKHLSDNHGKLMQSLKATRDQRLERIESSKVNFLDIVKMLQQKDIQAIEGRQMELSRLAGERELIRLGRPITYDDGNQDNPILCSDTVTLGPAEEE